MEAHGPADAGQTEQRILDVRVGTAASTRRRQRTGSARVTAMAVSPRGLGPSARASLTASMTALRASVAGIRAFHPVYAGAEDELIRFVDDYFAHGNLRNWEAFTHSAADLCRRHRRSTVDEEIARDVFALHGGGIGAE